MKNEETRPVSKSNTIRAGILSIIGIVVMLFNLKSKTNLDESEIKEVINQGFDLFDLAWPLIAILAANIMAIVARFKKDIKPLERPGTGPGGAGLIILSLLVLPLGLTGCQAPGMDAGATWEEAKANVVFAGGMTNQGGLAVEAKLGPVGIGGEFYLAPPSRVFSPLSEIWEALTGGPGDQAPGEFEDVTPELQPEATGGWTPPGP